MALTDSVDKIVTRYFAVVTAEEFIYKGKTYLPKPIKISPLIFRDYTCPAKCGACCPRFSLDYLPWEKVPYQLKARSIEFNGKVIGVNSDLQLDHNNYHCRNLSQEDARCGIHKNRPFSCDFELIRALSFADDDSPNVLTQKLFGRGWAMKRIDGGRGARCEMTPVTDQSITEVIRKIQRLEEWCNHFQLKNKCGRILTWIHEVRPFLEFRQIKPALIK